MKKQFTSFSSSIFTTFSIFLVTLIGLISSINAQSTQKDSCSQQLGLSVNSLIPFNTSSLRCISAWTSQSFILRYAKSGQSLWSFVLSAPDNKAYISMGFSSDGNMDGSSAVVGWISGNGAGVAKEYYLGGKHSDECPPDQGNLQLVANKTAIISQSPRLYLSFQLTVAEGSQPEPYLIFAVGPSNNLPSSSDYYLPTHRDQAAYAINYTSGAGSSTGSKFAVEQWHGLLTLIGWGVLIPLGVMAARYFKHLDPLWFYSHRSILGAGFVLGSVGVILGFTLDDDSEDGGEVDCHKAIGTIVLVLCSLQVTAFLLRPSKDSKMRRYWNWYHHNAGRAAMALGIANIFFGLAVAGESVAWFIAYGLVLGLCFISALILELKRYCCCIADQDLEKTAFVP